MRTLTFRLPAYWTLGLIPHETAKMDPHDEELMVRWLAWASHTYNLGECIDASETAQITANHAARACIGSCVTREFTFEVLPADAVAEPRDTPLLSTPVAMAMTLVVAAIIAVLLYGSRPVECRASGEVPRYCVD